MLIGIDASRANQEQKTGVEWYAFFLIQNLKKLGNEEIKKLGAQFVLYSQEPLKGELAVLPENWESRVLRWPPQRLWTQVRLSWEMLVSPPDVLFIPAHAPPLIHPEKTVMMVHDVAAVKFPESYSWFERWYSTWSAKYALNKLWRVIVPSEFTKSELLEIRNWKLEIRDKIFVIPHGYDRRYRKTDDQTAINNVLTRYGIKKPFILSVGRLETKKNTARIIQAFDKIIEQGTGNSEQLVLVGKPGHGWGKVKEALEQSPYKDRIIFPNALHPNGWVTPEEIVCLMNAAELFISPSLYEGFGLPVLDALACGTPVVAGRGSSLEEVGGDACVYVDPFSVEDIAQGINKIMQNAECRMQNATKGLERIKNFSWERCARETMKVLLDTKQKPD